MARFNVIAQNQRMAVCKNCFTPLIGTFCESGCGKPLALCSYCMCPYILDCNPFTGDELADYVWSHIQVNGKWQWVPVDEFCIPEELRR